MYAAQKRYYAKLGPIHAERRRAFYAANRKRLQAKQREYNAQNKQKRAEYAKEDAHRHFFRVRAGNLRLKHDASEATASKFDLAKLWHSQKGVCPFTGIRLNRSNAHLDHINPIIRGGSGTIENLRWVYRSVNYAKRELSDKQFYEMCELVVTHRKQRS